MNPSPPLLEPPEPEFWQHYSPHHEFPISTLVSVALYALAAVLIAALAWALGGHRTTDPVPIVTVDIGDNGPGGPPGGVPGQPAAVEPPVAAPVPPPKAFVPPELPTPEPRPGQIEISPTARPKAVPGDPLGELERNIAGMLRDPAGNGGTGGVGPPGGPSGTKNVRTARLARWQVDYSTSGGDDHLRKLAVIGCRLALPVPGDPTQVDLIRDPSRRPVRLERTGVEAINRLPWFFVPNPQAHPGDPGTIDDLAAALGLRPTPPAIIAFLPPEFERQLLDREMAYARQHGRSREEQIELTVFQLRFVGNSYRLAVDRQAYR